MSLPYPTDDRQNLQIPDPDNPLPQFQGHPPPSGTPFTHPGGGHPQPGYPPQPYNGQPGYPQPPQYGQPVYPPQPPALYPQLPGQGYPHPGHPAPSMAPGYGQPPPQPFHEQPGFPQPLSAPGVTSPGNAVREFMSEVKQNEGLLPKSGQLLGLGKKLGKHVLGEIMNQFQERANNKNNVNRHSYFVQREDVGDEASTPSDYKEIQRKAPRNVMKIKNFDRSQDYKTLKTKFLSRKQIFEDDKFPAHNSMLSDTGGGNNYIMSYGGRMRVRPTEIKWLRPHEIARDPRMYVGKRDRFDINQGEIGDCWFLAALANLAEDDEAFHRVVPGDQSFSNGKYCGMFRFRFFRFGEWVEIVIDDRLPTRNGKLIYLKAKEDNEFWSPLLEKAYAKLYGSYKALEGGLTIESAVDFTGGIPEMIDISHLQMKEQKLFDLMRKADANNAFMSCSLSNSRYQSEAVSLGLQARHAYTITKVTVVSSRSGNGNIPLIRMRNPHGNAKEWRGAWSDNDDEWRKITDSQRRALGLTFDNDGEFYMNFNRDFLRYFGEVEIVHKTPGKMMADQGSEIKYEVMYFQGAWDGNTAGGCGNDSIGNFVKNPQYVFTLTDPDTTDDQTTCSLILSLAQRVEKRKTEHAIGFRVYRLSPDMAQVDAHFAGRNHPVGKTDQYVNLREVSTRLVLPPGKYVVIPTTFNRGERGQFLVRLFTEKHWGASRQADKHTYREGEGIQHQFNNVVNIPIHRMAINDGRGDEVDGDYIEAKKEDGLLKRAVKKGMKFIMKFPKDRKDEIDILKDAINEHVNSKH